MWKKNGILGIGVMLLYLGCVSNGLAAQTETIENDIRSLDQEERSELVRDVIREINQAPPVGARTNPTNPVLKPTVTAHQIPENAAAPPKQHAGRSDKSVPASNSGGTRVSDRASNESNPGRGLSVNSRLESDASAWNESEMRRAAGNRDFLQSVRRLPVNYIKILNERENHLLITVGDVVYLNSSKKEKVHSNERYFIYKFVPPPATRTTPGMLWFEEVGQLKILESNEQLTIGRVISARDIIQKGDFVLLR